MAAFPSNLKVLIGTSESPSPVVARSEMERGVAKQRRIAADSIVTIPVEVVFQSQQEAVDFEDWFYDNTTGAQGGAAWFDWTDPRTSTVVEARIVGGQLGPLIPVRERYNLSTRSMTFEIVRSTL